MEWALANDVVKSARRVLEVFELFAELRRPASVGEIATRLGYPQSSTSVLLKSLVALKYLNHDPLSRTFIPSLRFALAGSWIHDEMISDRTLMRVMVDLQAETGDTVVLGAQNGIHVQYLHVLQGTTTLRLYMRTGALRPLCRTAAGKVLLSLHPDDEVRALVRRINAAQPDPAQRVDLAALLDDLAECRERGFAVSEGAATPGAAVVAVPLPARPGQPPMALGLGSAIETMRPRRDHVVELLQRASAPYRASAAVFG